MAPMSTIFFRRLRHIDLSGGTVRDELLEPELFEHLLGGGGLAAELFSRFPESRAFFAPGPLTGSGIPFSRGWSALFRPAGRIPGASCLLAETSGSGGFGTALAGCALEGVLIRGTAPRPSLLDIDTDGATVSPLPDALLKLDPVRLEEELSGGDPGRTVICCGKAAWAGSPIASIIHEGAALPSNGGTGALLARLGLGAVRVTRGDSRRRPSDPGEFERLATRSFSSISEALDRKEPAGLVPQGRRRELPGRLLALSPVRPRAFDALLLPIIGKTGTAALLPSAVSAKLLRTENGPVTSCPDPAAIDARAQPGGGCPECPFPCGGRLRLEGRFGETAKPGFAELAAACFAGYGDLPEALHFIESCRRQGLDPLPAALSAGREIAELAEGAIPCAPAAGGARGFPFSFDPLTVLSVHLSCTPSAGDLPTLGEYQIGGWWKSVKGLPRPAVLYHKQEDFWVEKEKAVIAGAVMERSMVRTAAGICPQARLVSEKRFPLFALLNAFTGWERTGRGYLETGRRIAAERVRFFPPPLRLPLSTRERELLALTRSLRNPGS